MAYRNAGKVTSTRLQIDLKTECELLITLAVHVNGDMAWLSDDSDDDIVDLPHATSLLRSTTINAPTLVQPSHANAGRMDF